jgi:hypothetical protein
MKNLLKTTVLLIAGLLAAQPVLSSLSCVAGMAPACAPDCPMAMSSMAPDCPMNGMGATGMTADQGCQRNCCTRNAFDAVLPRIGRDKSQVAIHVPVAAFAVTFAAAQPERPATDSFDPLADSPPRYIMNRVFRI